MGSLVNDKITDGYPTKSMINIMIIRKNYIHITIDESDYERLKILACYLIEIFHNKLKKNIYSKFEPIYIPIEDIRFKKEFDRLNRIDFFLKKIKADSGYVSNKNFNKG
ncbi:MAG: hypothetical protein ACMUEM_06160 [Flavobacteriales bacterium AspAUS03]